MTDSQKLDMLLEMVTGIKKEQSAMKEEQCGMKEEQRAIKEDISGLKSQVSENTAILKALEDRTSTYKAEHDRISNKLDHIQGDITSLKKESEKGEEAYNIVQTLKNAFSK